MKQIFFFILIINFLTACSSTTEDQTHDKNFSAMTEREFQKIENTNYRNDHLKKINDLSKSETLKTPAYKTVNNQFTISTSKDGNDDSIAELNQNLAFYCMKGSRKSHFKNESECQNFVKSSLDLCEKNHRIVNRSLINCVKSKLKIK